MSILDVGACYFVVVPPAAPVPCASLAEAVRLALVLEMRGHTPYVDDCGLVGEREQLVPLAEALGWWALLDPAGCRADDSASASGPATRVLVRWRSGDATRPVFARRGAASDHEPEPQDERRCDARVEVGAVRREPGARD